jgi:hypothetical protein
VKLSENCFKQLKPNVYGHIKRQIAINASVQNNINQFLTQGESKKIEKFELKNLYDKIVAINNENPGNLLRIIFKGNYASGDE